MNGLQVTARFKIHAGALAEFQRLAAECVRSVREKDTGTLQYDWFLSEDQTECVVREAYRDSAAVFEHIGNLGPLLGELASLADMSLELYGSPSVELVEASAAMSPRVYSHFLSP